MPELFLFTLDLKFIEIGVKDETWLVSGRHEKSLNIKSPTNHFDQSYVLRPLMPAAGCQDHSKAQFKFRTFYVRTFYVKTFYVRTFYVRTFYEAPVSFE